MILRHFPYNTWNPANHLGWCWNPINNGRKTTCPSTGLVVHWSTEAFGVLLMARAISRFLLYPFSEVPYLSKPVEFSLLNVERWSQWKARKKINAKRLYCLMLNQLLRCFFGWMRDLWVPLQLQICGSQVDDAFMSKIFWFTLPNWIWVGLFNGD